MIDFIEIWKSLGSKYRIRFIWLISLSWIASVSELLSIGTLVPFLTVLIAPKGAITSLPVLGQLFDSFKIYQISNEKLVYMMGAIFGALVCGNSIIRWRLSTECASLHTVREGYFLRAFLEK